MAKNLPPAENKLMWCETPYITYKNTTNICCTWKIHDFSLRSTEADFALKSPIFPGVAKEEYNWQIVVYPNGKQLRSNFLIVELHFLPGKISKINGQYDFYLQGDKLKLKIYPTGKVERNEFNERTVPIQHMLPTDPFIKPNLYLMPNNVLTIICEIMTFENTTYNANKNNSERQNVMACHRLQNDLTGLFTSPKFCDVKFITSGREIQAHKAILAVRSPVFAAMFNHEMKERQENQVNIVDVNYDVMKEMLRYIYTGKTKNLNKMAEGLLIAADKYQLKALKDECENALSKTIAKENAASLFLLGDVHSAVQLKAKALNFIVANLKDVIETANYQSLLETRPNLIYETLEIVANRRNELTVPAAKKQRLE